MRDDVTDAAELSEVEAVIVAAVRRWLSSLRDEADTLTAALPLASDAWASALSTDIAPALGAGFMAEAARNAPDVPRQGALDILVGWPEGVDGPGTVSELLDAYPATFAGVSASQVTFILASPTWTASFAEYMRTTVNLVSKMPDTVFVEMNTALSKTVGEGLFERKKAVREFLSWEGEGGYVGWMRRAERIARTETATATNTAQFTAAKAKQDAGLPQKKQWNSAADERTRESHKAADGQIRDFDEPFDVGDDLLDHPGDRVHGSAKETINCVVGSTMVAGPGQDISTCYRRPVTGRFVHLRIANGGVLTCTPNHPVLTPAGYLPAGRLREGDSVLASESAWSPDVDDAPPRIGEAFDAVSRLRDPLRVSGERLDFHGDGVEDKEVEVVSTDGVLRDDLDAAFGGYFGEQGLVRLGDTAGSPSGCGAVDGGGESVGSGSGEAAPAALSSSSQLSGQGHRPALLRRHPGRSEPVGFGAAADGEAEGFEPSGNRWSGTAETLSHLEDAHALGMKPTKIIGVDEYFGSHDVYNLETEKGYYIANGVIVHNCRCNCTYIDADDADILDTAANINNIDDLDRLIEEMEKEMGITAAGAKALAWEGRLAPVGEPTGDGRVFNEDGEFRFREFPLPLLWQETTSDGHDSSRVVGTIDSGEITETGVMGKGVVFADEEKVLHLLESGVIRPSVDLCDMVCELQETTGDDGAEGELLRVSSATVMAATLVAKPAFENVGVWLTGDEVDASESAEALTASAGAPVLELTRYSADQFADPALSGPTPVTVTEDGRVYGHLALWDSCHVGMPGRCVTPPRSSSGYASFHQSTVQTDDGPLAVGRLTVGGGHADARAGVRAAAEHYDQTGATWAFVRAGEDEFGIWVAGQVHAAASADQINAGASAPLSGDWRRVGGGMELVAALSVSTPGFPVRREYTTTGGALGSLVAAAQITPAAEAPAPASLTEDQVSSLVAAMAPALAREMHRQQRRHRLAAAAAVLSADAREERRARLAAAGAVFSVDCEEGAATDDDADDDEQEDGNGVR